MKIGIIGFGSIGKRHYENLLRHTKNIAVLSKRSDLNLPSLARNFSDFKKLGPYDAIFITNETSKHVATLKKCFPLKPKAVFIEKPVSHNSRGLESVAKKAKKLNIRLWVGYSMQFYRPFVMAKKIIKNGTLGRIYYMRISIGQDLREWRPGRDYSKIYSAKKELGGGALLDLVHDINYPAWLLNDVLITKRSFVRKISNLKINTEDFAESVFISKKKKVVVSVHHDYLRVPGKRYFEIAGGKGSLVWDLVSGEMALETAKSARRKKIEFARNEMYIKEIKYFLKAMKKKRDFSNMEEAIRDVKNVEYLKKHGR